MHFNKLITSTILLLISVICSSQNSGIFIDERDNHQYKWVKIGEQIWMAENLAFMPNIDSIYTAYGNGGYRYGVYDFVKTGNYSEDTENAKSSNNYKEFGVLYPWFSAVNGIAFSETEPSNLKGVCPERWHLPSMKEWKKLAEFVCSETENYSVGNLYNVSWWTDIGKHIKTKSGWNGDEFTGNGDDKYGFSAKPGGWHDGLRFHGLGDLGIFWTSSQYNKDWGIAFWLTVNNARHRLSYGIPYLPDYSNGSGSIGKGAHFSVRCVCDSIPLYIATNTNEIETLDDVLAYPNPVNSYIRVNIPKSNAAYSIYNSSGILIKQGRIDEYIINDLDVPQGIYILKITNEGVVNTLKFVKQ